MSNWISWNDLTARWTIRDSELLEYLSKGLQPYSDYDFHPIPCPESCHEYFKKFNRSTEIEAILRSLNNLLSHEKELKNPKAVHLKISHPGAFDVIDSICDIFKKYDGIEDIFLTSKEFDELKKIRNEQKWKLKKIQNEIAEIIEEDPDCISWKFFIMPSGEDAKQLVSDLKIKEVVFKKLNVETIEKRVEKNKTKTNQNLRPNQKHKIACRETAKGLWDNEPTITIADMAYKDEINSIFNGKVYQPDTIRNWIKDLCPDRSPGRRGKKAD